jgi:Mrp family chromosome partitioning ATPase
MPESPLEAYLRAMKAHKLLVGLVVLATVLACVAWLAYRTPEYQATAQLLINPLPQDDESFLGLPTIKDAGDPTRTIQTAAAVLKAPEAARLAARRTGPGWTQQRVLDAIDIQPAGQSNIVDVVARADTGGDAATLANAFVAATLQQRADAIRRAAGPVIGRLSRIRARLPAGDPSAASIQSRITALEEARVRGDPTTEFSRAATSATSAEGAPSWLVVLLAVIAGIVLASVAALVLELVGPRTIRAAEELEQLDPTPVLARVPRLRARARRRRRAFPPVVPASVLPGFRSLHLQLRVLDGEHRTILFSSPSPRDGKTTCVVDFTLELAAAGQEVILFDLDPHKPDLTERLGVGDETDLRAALEPGGGLADAVVAVPGLPLVGAVPGIRNPDGSTLEQVEQRLPELVDEGRATGAYVVIDTSSLGELGDALRFIRTVDDLVLVARVGNTRVADVEVVRDLLARARKPATGYVVVDQRATVTTSARGPEAAFRRAPATP